ncbi:zinc dependent phospholipase C family protein [Desertivirga arenae]|uniref:zinc dependent phospholipase C family protein n=1 Tax=Desertivirga arenae TaxID=2810309 RepID=UPI001A979236|nr:zinc dependent phospholipase C family protein [Pedobacter sp. SYSU D00823]
MRNFYSISFLYTKYYFLSLVTACSVLMHPVSSKAYCLLTHEAIIDASWKSVIEPKLLARFPQAKEKELLKAHSYAYGGAIMPDIGYSPFGSMVYTDFVHNVRTGDYVTALLEEAETLDELAFALGALAHYLGDNYGHRLATNVAVPLVYPQVGRDFGDTVTYAQDHLSHSRMEFAFDVLQTARGNYASKQYHDFIGFNISIPVIEKAFYRTYGVALRDVFKSLPVAISTYRWTIKSVLPTIVRTAWAKKKSDIKKLNPSATARIFSYRMKNRTYYHEFGKDHQRAGVFPTVLSVLIPVLPKIGPLAKLKFKEPTVEAEKLFIRSFDSTLVYYRKATTVNGNSGTLSFANKALDTGFPTAWGEYPIADDSYINLLLKLNEKHFQNVSPEIMIHLTNFFNPAKAPGTRKSRKKWKEVNLALNNLRSASLSKQEQALLQER